MKTVSIIIPVYNEERTIGAVLEAVRRSPLRGWKKEIFVIDDGSTDGTRKVLKSWESHVSIMYKASNEGKGSAVSEGLRQASGDIILIQDADSEYNPEDYPELLKPFDHPQVTVVYGSRFLGPHLSTMFVYAFGNKFVTFLCNILFNANLTDMETGYKAFRKSAVSGIRICAKGFDFEPEITAKLLRDGHQIYEVPISYFGRKFSEGKKLTWKDGVVAVITLIRYRFTL